MESFRTHRTAMGQSKVFIESVSYSSAVLSCEFHKSGKFLVSSNSAGEIHICPTDSSTEKLAYLKGHRESVTEVHYSNDGLNIYSSSKDRSISIWDASRGVRKSLIFGHNSAVNTVQCLASTIPIIVSGSSDKSIRVWDIRQRTCASLLKSQHEVAAVTFSSQYVYSGGLNNGDITVWDVRQDVIAHVLTGHSDSVTGLSVSPCMKYLASCSADGTLRKWDISSSAEMGKEIQSFPLEQGQGDQSQHLRRCAWSPDGRMVSTGSGSQVVVFDATSGSRLCEFNDHREEIIDVAFHPRKKILCSAGADKKMITRHM